MTTITDESIAKFKTYLDGGELIVQAEGEEIAIIYKNEVILQLEIDEVESLTAMLADAMDHLEKLRQFNGATS